MRNKVLRTLQVGILTGMLVFCGLLVMDNFDNESFADPHHGYEYEQKLHFGILPKWYIGAKSTVHAWVSGGHDH